MNYRIRYRKPGHRAEGETLVEANSPTEAMVKFRCTRGVHPGVSHQQEEVTSVCAVDGGHWETG
jgi:hypothetical protein